MLASRVAGATSHGGVPRLRPWSGMSLLAYGFRPFFLGAGVWAVVGLGLWLGFLVHGIAVPSAFAPMQWHAHEMLFGFAGAAVGGFLLTAIPNWTGRLPLQGLPLAVLALLWLAGRLAVATSGLTGWEAAAVIDLAFPVALMAAALREVTAGRNWRNLPVVGALSLLIVANLLTHLEAGGIAATAFLGERLAVAVLAMMIGLIGGRIVPSFTTNWLKRRGERQLPAPFGRVDRAVLAITLLAALGWAWVADGRVIGAMLVLAGLAHVIRMARWRGWQTLSEPLLAVLHLGYLWLGIGLVLLGVDAWNGSVLGGAGLHVLTVGAFGTMILAVMTRATLGHTGRDLTAGPATLAVYALVTVATLARPAAGLLPDLYLPLLSVAGLAWITGFALFVITYGPMLCQARPDGKPG